MDFEFDDAEFVEALNNADLDIAENEEQLILISPKLSETLNQGKQKVVLCVAVLSIRLGIVMYIYSTS